MTEITKDKLKVLIFPDRDSMAKAAAKDVSGMIHQLLEEKPFTRMIFAAAPSQSEFLEALTNDLSIEWERIEAFHMDEYIGLDENAPQTFGNYLREHIFEKVSFRNVYYINNNAIDIPGECKRYETHLTQAQIGRAHV